MNTHEEYVSIETAKLLKQAGFDWDVNSYYWSEDSQILEFDDMQYSENHNKYDNISAPTQAVAMRWLREVKNCILEQYFGIYNGMYMVKIIRPIITNNVRYFKIDSDDQIYETYEQAAEAGIQECLKMILEKP